MKNPVMRYKCPGPHTFDGVSVDYVIVDRKDVEAIEAEGWFKTIPQAVEAAKPVKSVEAIEDAEPTREEMEQKATELGLKFDGRTSDKKLAAIIAEKV